MIYDYFGFKYAIWYIENDKFQLLKNDKAFNNDLKKSFFLSANSTKIGIKPKQSEGYAYSAPINSKHFYLFDQVFNPCLWDQFKDIGVDVNHLRFKRCWANKMHYDSSGKIHSHVDNSGMKVYTLICYYSIPKENSGDLIFLNPKKYHTKCFPESFLLNHPIEKIDETDKLHIMVSESMCVLHDGEIPHAVSKHKNESPREAIIIEFIYDDRRQL